jgi:putative ABC transport system substrate-binding protein
MSSSKQISFGWQILLLISLVVGCVLLSGCGKKTQKVYRVGILCSFEPFINIADGFKAKMTDLGYIEGKNIVYDLQIAHMDPEKERRAAKKFVEDKVDLIFAFSTEASITAKSATRRTDIPVVFAMAGIEGNNLIDSVSEPGGNITGVRYPGPDLVVKRFEFLRELAPQVKRLYIPYNPNYPTCLPSLIALRPVASSLGIMLVEDPVANIEELRTALEKQAKSADISIDAIQILPENLTQSPDGWAMISKFAKEHKLPLVGSALSSADNGGIFSYCVDFFEVGQQAAPIADKILKGTPAGSIMVVTPPTHLRLNYKVIKELELEVSECLLSKADEIIR